jgi:hypothetical protein
MAASLRIPNRQRWPVGKQCAPVDPEALPGAVGREVRLSGQTECAGTVSIVAVSDRTGKIATREEIHRTVDPAGAGDGLRTGIGPRLVVVGRRAERDEVGIVVVARELAVQSKVQAMAGGDCVAIVSGVPEGGQATGGELCVFTHAELRLRQLRHYQNRQPDDAIRDLHGPATLPARGSKPGVDLDP